MKIFENSHYGWKDSKPTCAHEYLLPTITKHIQDLSLGKSVKILDIGCGNGYIASKLAELGHFLIAVDVSPDGIDIARSEYPNLNLKVCSVYDEKLTDVVGELVDCVISLEVVEHLLYPKRLFEQSYRILKKGGYLIISTPYHGYLKNLAFSIVNGWDRHFKVEWDGGHIKFFSKRTLTRMVCDVGFKNPCFYGVGRLPWLWKSMIMVVEK
jgi:2-polyprenyl-3-methyl-5-hydroxy-6-metoxy-1,4-benzoquinol methylase